MIHVNVDWEAIRTSIEHFLVPIIGTISMKQRLEDNPKGPGPLTQFLASLVVAAIISVGGGLVSGYVLTVRLEERMAAVTKDVQRNEERLKYLERRQGVANGRDAEIVR